MNVVTEENTPALAELPEVRFTGGVLIGIYIVLVALATFAAWQIAPMTAKGGFENFSKVAGVLVTAASALMAAIVSIVNFDRNARETRIIAGMNGGISNQVAKLNGEIAKQVARINGETARQVALLNGDLAQKLADYKAEIDRKLLQDKVQTDFRLERLKAALSKENEAYFELMDAANTAYYILAKLECAKWTLADKDAVEQAMRKASGKLALLESRADADLWQRLWNVANRAAESAEELPSANDQNGLWAKEAGELGQMMQEFQRAVAEKLHRTS